MWNWANFGTYGTGLTSKRFVNVARAYSGQHGYGTSVCNFGNALTFRDID